MEPAKTLYAGLDLCDRFSQLCCFNERIFEPEEIERKPGLSMIPTVLAVKEDTKEWFFGEDAIELSKKREGCLVERILERIAKNEEFLIYGTAFTGIQILEKYFRKTLSLLKQYYPNDTIKRLVVSVSEMDMQVIRVIYKALQKMGIEKDRAQVISHEQAYLYYSLSQKKELWMNDIGMFDFDYKGLTYHQISINRRTLPMVAGVTHKDFTETLSYDLLMEQGNNGGIDYIFENIAKSVLHKQIISTVYITGAGFEGSWAAEVLKELCVGRRLFAGQNLYTKGACYAARELENVQEDNGQGKLKDFIFLSREMVPCSITMKLYHNASVEEMLLIKAGMPWFEATIRITIIPDQEDELEFSVRDVMKRTQTSHIISLGEIKGRPNKTTRLDIHIHFTDIKTFIIGIKDRGFGELYPTSNRIWEKTISLG